MGERKGHLAHVRVRRTTRPPVSYWFRFRLLIGCLPVTSKVTSIDIIVINRRNEIQIHFLCFCSANMLTVQFEWIRFLPRKENTWWWQQHAEAASQLESNSDDDRADTNTEKLQPNKR